MLVIRLLKQIPTQEQVEKLGISISNNSFDQYSQEFGRMDSIRGTCVPGLPVFIATNQVELNHILTERNYYREGEGYVLVAEFADELFESGKAILGKNKAFVSQLNKQPYVRMSFKDGAFYLPIDEEKYIDIDLVHSFDDKRQLKSLTGEYYLSAVPPRDTYNIKVLKYDNTEQTKEVRIVDLPAETSELNIN